MTFSIHLGAHKTATTHLQSSLYRVQDKLRAAGVWYGGPEVLRGDALPLVNSLYQDDPDADAARSCRETLLDLRARHAEILLSDENLLGGTAPAKLFRRDGTLYPLAEERLQRLGRITPALGPATVFLSIRDPGPFVSSCYALQLALGRKGGIDSYLDGTDPGQLSWAGLARRILDQPVVGRLVVWRYEDYGALRSQVLGRMLPGDCAASVPNPPPNNLALSQAGYEWLIAETDLRGGPSQSQAYQRAKKTCPRERGEPAMNALDPLTCQMSAAAYADDVAALAAIDRVEMLRP